MTTDRQALPLHQLLQSLAWVAEMKACSLERVQPVRPKKCCLLRGRVRLLLEELTTGLLGQVQKWLAGRPLQVQPWSQSQRQWKPGLRIVANCRRTTWAVSCGGEHLHRQLGKHWHAVLGLDAGYEN